MIIEWRVVVFAQGAIMCQTSCFIVTQPKLLKLNNSQFLNDFITHNILKFVYKLKNILDS